LNAKEHIQLISSLIVSCRKPSWWRSRCQLYTFAVGHTEK